MSRLRSSLIALSALLHGCSCDPEPILGSNDTGSDGSGDLDGAVDPDGAVDQDGAVQNQDSGRIVCVEEGGGCSAAIDCCSLTCDGTTFTCSSTAAGICTETSAGCDSAVECCSNRCEQNACALGSGGCRMGGATCQADHNCCSMTCSNGTCEGDGDPCRTTGDSCTTDSQCCSSICGGDGRCARLPLCRAAGEPCTTPGDCCSNTCGADGYCPALSWCKPAFEPCSTDVDCCSFKCVRDVDGFKRCDAIGGCRPSGPTLTPQGIPNAYGEICGDDAQCCSMSCTADDDGVDRCTKLGDPECDGVDQVCLPLGELCETDCECCTGRCDRPRPPDAQGFAFPKRCLTGTASVATCAPTACQSDAECDQAQGESCDPSSQTCAPNNNGDGLADGEPCGDPGECCSGFCLPWPDGAYRCGLSIVEPPDAGPGDATPVDAAPDAGTPQCVPQGQTCTTNSDCCSGLLCTPSGADLICDISI